MEMKLVEFIQKYCQNYEERLEQFKKNSDEFRYENELPKLNTTEISWLFLQTYFSEIIKNFANQLCEKQRENCAVWATDDAMAVNGSFNDFYESIKNIEQPKIEEL